MKKKIKLILFIISFFATTGCNVKYSLSITDIEISEMVSIENEDIIVNDENSMINTFNKDYGKNYDIHFNDDILIDCYDALRDDCYKYEENYPFHIEAFSKINNIINIEDSQVIKDFFGKIDINENNKNVVLKAIPNSNLEMIFSNVNLVSQFVNNLEISIYVTYNVVSHNADSVNGNTYTWIYNKDNLSKEINMTYSKEEILNNDDSSINDLDNNNNNNNVNNLNKNNYIGYIFLAIAGIVIIIIGVKFIHKIRKNDAV